MTDYNIRARQYHIHAAHLRWLASADENLETRDALFSIARRYERLAAKYSALAPETVVGAHWADGVLTKLEDVKRLLAI